MHVQIRTLRALATAYTSIANEFLAADDGAPATAAAIHARALLVAADTLEREERERLAAAYPAERTGGEA